MQLNPSSRVVPACGAAGPLPVAVLGAGPVGLAAAAYLLEHGIEPVVFESGDSVGANLLDFGHVRLFSPWRYNIDHAVARRLKAAGWTEPALDELPLARDVVDHVLKPFAALPKVAPHLRLAHRVVGVTRDGFDKVKTAGREDAPFVVRVERDGGEAAFRVRAVLDGSGTWTHPNSLGANGLPATGEEQLRARIRYGIPDVLGGERARYAGKRVLVVGAGHSVATSLMSTRSCARPASVRILRSPASCA